MFQKILIANRGEIACRVMRTARKLSIRTVAVYSDADRDAMHVAMADEAYRVGPAPARNSYLDSRAILNVAVRSGAQAVHPGYGFLSENADFAEACEAAGVTFIGPPALAIRAMGGKSEAKALMRTSNIPLVPGYHGDDQDPLLLAKEAETIGFPVIIKASAGGGGKGIKIVNAAGEFSDQLASAKREAGASFGNDRVLIERYLARPRHVEVQVFADKHGNCVYIFDRDCSIQRRHQKILEEAPAPDLPAKVRSAMGEAAVAAACAIGYVGAGTVEFLYAPEDQSFYFMEMNTRLQVEHPVTEMITGLDLVDWQLRVAAGLPLPLDQSQLSATGHAIEVRLYAEDPARDFLPQAGRIDHFETPEASVHVRLDTGVRAGDSISVHYDPMIAKLIVWDRDRGATVRRLQDVLYDTHIVGLRNNVEFLREIAGHAKFAAGELDTNFIQRHQVDLFKPESSVPDEAFFICALGHLLRRRDEGSHFLQAYSNRSSPWNIPDGWRMNSDGREILELIALGRDQDVRRRVDVLQRRDGWWFKSEDSDFLQARGELHDGKLSADIAEKQFVARWFERGGTITIVDATSKEWRFKFDGLEAQGEVGAAPPGQIKSPMPGRVAAVLVEPGARIEAGQPLVIVEAMKMEHTLRAPQDGVVASVACKAGDQVEEGRELVVLVPPANES
jgi:3-methylcrotonyl-CoA carboxylase alpha subunit